MRRSKLTAIRGNVLSMKAAGYASINVKTEDLLDILDLALRQPKRTGVMTTPELRERLGIDEYTRRKLMDQMEPIGKEGKCLLWTDEQVAAVARELDRNSDNGAHRSD